MVERMHVPYAERAEDMEKIKKLTAELRSITENLNAPPSLKAAYMNSVLNLEKKNEHYGTEKIREKLSDEEKLVMKEALKKFRENKTEISEVSPDNDSNTGHEGVKKGKKHANR